MPTAPDLANRLGADHWSARRDAANGLAAADMLESREVAGFTVRRIAKGLEDNNRRVQDATGEVLKGITRAEAFGTPGSAAAIAVPELTLRLADTDLRSRRVARDAFATIASTGVVGDMGIASASAVPQLTEKLRDEDWCAREAALFTFGELGLAAIPAATDIIKCMVDPSKKVREAAKACLWLLSTRGALPDLHSFAADALPTLEAGLRHDDWEVRQAACWALGRTGGTGALALHLLAEDMTDGDPGIRLLAVQAVSRMGVAALCAVHLLAARIEDTSSRVRAAAVGGLHAFAKAMESELEAATNPLLVPHDVQKLVNKLSDRSVEVRANAAKLLGDMGGAVLLALPQLVVHGLLDPTPAVSGFARQTIQKLQGEGWFGIPGRPTGKTIVAALQETIETEDEEDYVRVSAMEALTRLVEHSAFAFLPPLRVVVNPPERRPEEDSRHPHFEVREGLFLKKLWREGALVELGKVTRFLVDELEGIVDDEVFGGLAEGALSGLYELIEVC